MHGSDSDLAETEVKESDDSSNGGGSSEKGVEKDDLRDCGRLKSSMEEPQKLS